MRKLSLFLLIPAIAFADPSPATRWLMNEPATLFELGFVRAEKYMADEKERFAEHLMEINGERPDLIWSYALYGYDDDTYLFGVRFVDTNHSLDQLERACIEFLHRYSFVMKVEVTGWFSHFIDAPASRMPENFLKSLLAKSKMECRVSRAEGERNVLHVTRNIGTGLVSKTRKSAND